MFPSIFRSVESLKAEFQGQSPKMSIASLKGSLPGSLLDHGMPHKNPTFFTQLQPLAHAMMPELVRNPVRGAAHAAHAAALLQGQSGSPTTAVQPPAAQAVETPQLAGSGAASPSADGRPAVVPRLKLPGLVPLEAGSPSSAAAAAACGPATSRGPGGHRQSALGMGVGVHAHFSELGPSVSVQYHSSPFLSARGQVTSGASSCLLSPRVGKGGTRESTHPHRHVTLDRNASTLSCETSCQSFRSRWDGRRRRRGHLGWESPVCLSA